MDLDTPQAAARSKTYPHTTVPLKYGQQNRMLHAEFLGKAGPQRHSRVAQDLSAAGLITPTKAWEKSMRVPVLGATALVAGGVTIAIATVQSLSTSAQTQNRARYLPEYTASGDLILPKDFHEWVYVGSPLTPNALNDGMANFPEFHNVYIEPGSYEIYKQTNQFPEGTIMFKELQLTQPGEEP